LDNYEGVEKAGREKEKILPGYGKDLKMRVY
jgi:hypothetical protein